MSLPNSITLIRILIAPFFFTTLMSYRGGEERYRLLAFGLFLAACLTDALDGFLARVLKKRTQLGRFLDPLADKLIILSGFLGILFVDNLRFHPPLWITVTVVFRELVILTGMIVIYLLSGGIEIKPNFLGKCTAASQMATLVSILLQWRISVVLWYVMAALTVLSGLAYVKRDLKKLQVFT